MTVWLDYASQVEYLYDRSTQKCVSYDLTSPMMEIQIPDDASFAETYLIGSEYVSSWYLPPNGDLFETLDVTADSCLPVQQIFVNQTSNNQVFPSMITDFNDMVPFVPPFVFDTIDACNNAKIIRSPSNNKFFRI